MAIVEVIVWAVACVVAVISLAFAMCLVQDFVEGLWNRLRDRIGR